MIEKTTKPQWSPPPAGVPLNVIFAHFSSPEIAPFLNDAKAWVSANHADATEERNARVASAALAILEKQKDAVRQCYSACEGLDPNDQVVDEMCATLIHNGQAQAGLDLLYDVKLSKKAYMYCDNTILALSYKGDFESLKILEDTLIDSHVFSQMAMQRNALQNAPAGKRPIFVASLARSGTAFISNTCVRVTGWPFLNPATKIYPQPGTVYTDLLETAKHHGVVMVSHLSCTPEALERIAQGGIERVYVHIRDPRQATLSWSRYLDQHFAQAETEWLRYLGIMGLPGDYRDWSPEARLHWLVEHYYPKCVTWIEDWVQAVDSYQGLDFALGEYSDFSRDSASYINSIFDYFETGHVIETAHLPSKQDEAVHFHAANPNAWREQFNETDCARMTEGLKPEMCTRFAWDI